jgi:uncharacterized protein (TIGR02996 family)
MDEREQFLAAITSSPKDYTKRLIFADWLDDHGEHEEAERQRKYQAAFEWIRDFADKIDQGHTFLLEQAERRFDPNWSIDDKYDYYFNMGENEGYKRATTAEWEEFWSNYEIVTGKKVPMDGRDSGPSFTCSC